MGRAGLELLRCCSCPCLPSDDLNIAIALDVVNGSLYILKMTTVHGYIREIRPRYLAKSQRQALADADVTLVYEQGSRRGNATRLDLERSLRSGDVVAVLHAFLMADQSVRGKSRADFWKAVDAIESRGATIWELYTGLRSANPRERDMMFRAAIEALARGRHKRNENDKRGRPGWKPTDDELAKARAIWGSRKHKTWKDALAALQKLDKRWSQARAYRVLKKRNED